MPKRRHEAAVAEQYAALRAYAEEQRAAGEPARGPTFRVDRLCWLKDAKRRAMQCPKEREYE